MAFTYYPPEETDSDNWATQLQHDYFVRVSPDRRHLVPGMLHQGKRPKEGVWLKVGDITRDFPARYFVQYVDFKTLVPGSLISADHLPKGNWREIEPQRVPVHRFVSISPWGPQYGEPPEGFVNDIAQFNYIMRTEILPIVYPDYADDILVFHLFYFHGTFSEFDGDVSRLISYDAPEGVIKLTLYDTPELVQSGVVLSNLSLGSVIFVIRPEAPAGYYMQGVGILNEEGKVRDYIILEDFFHKAG